MQTDDYVSHKKVKNYNTNQFPSLAFPGTHMKQHGVWGFSKHYYMLLDPKISHGTCVIHWIPCDCAVCASMLDKPWNAGVLPSKQPHYQKDNILHILPSNRTF